MSPIINFIVSGQELRISQPVIVTDTIDYLEARCDFRGGIWDGLLKFAHFTKVGGTEDDVYDVALVNDLIRREEHLNLTTGIWRVWLHGMRIEDGEEVLRITTNIGELHVQRTGALEGEVFPTVTPSVGEQFVAAAVAAKEAAEDAAESAEQDAQSASGASDSATAAAAAAAASVILADAAKSSAQSSAQTASDAASSAVAAKDDAETAAESAESSASTAAAAAVHAPRVSDDGTWEVWDQETEAYVDTGLHATGHSPYIDSYGYWRYWDDELQTWMYTTTKAKGQDGQTPRISAYATVAELGGQPSVNVSVAQIGANVSMMFAFANLKGADGADGDDYVLTSADKQEIAQIVLGELPTMEGGTY